MFYIYFLIYNHVFAVLWNNEIN